MSRGPAGRHALLTGAAGGAAVFLAGDEASYITAQTIDVDGGSVMS